MNTEYLVSGTGVSVTLRTISAADLERLRVWKNDHRFAFFHQGTIEPDQQLRWHQGYTERAGDHMYATQSGGEIFGCMGFRLIDGRADIYNVILGRPECGGRGLMSEAIRLMCSLIAGEFTTDIGAEVLLSNPARAWYAKNAFREAERLDRFVRVQLDWERFQPCVYRKSDVARDPAGQGSET